MLPALPSCSHQPLIITPFIIIRVFFCAKTLLFSQNAQIPNTPAVFSAFFNYLRLGRIPLDYGL
jgi:hypothetical protein